MSRFLLCLSLLFPVASALRAQEPAAADQREYSDSINGCGPATMLNLLKFSAPEYKAVHNSLLGATDGVKMRYIVDRYFKNRPSEAYPGQKRWGIHGIECGDLVLGINEMLSENGIPAFTSTYLDRREGESEADHLLRCHDLISRSIRNGVMPILSLRSFVVKRREENANEPTWETANHHYMLVTGVRAPPSATGFEVNALDPWGGKGTVITLHREAHGRAFRALKGTQESGVWLEGKPFLQALAPDVPSLTPKDLTWSERLNVVANFLIGRF